MLFEKWSGSNNRLTRHSCSGKHSRLLGGHSLRSIHFIWFLTTWVMVGNTSKCVFVLISMLGWVKDSHYSSCFVIQFIKAGPLIRPIVNLPTPPHFIPKASPESSPESDAASTQRSWHFFTKAFSERQLFFVYARLPHAEMRFCLHKKQERTKSSAKNAAKFQNPIVCIV